MDARGARVDTVIRNATVVTVDDDATVLTGASVAVHQGRIVAVGADDEVAAAHSADTHVDARGGILIPALVNAHTHLAMTLFRGVADDRDLQAFLATVMPAEARLLSPETVSAGVELAVAESLLAGCTTALDMYYWPEVARGVGAAAGFRVVNGPVMVGSAGPDGRGFDDLLRWADRYLATTDGPRWVMPHSTYTLSPEQLRATADLAQRHDARVHVHAAENSAEVRDVVSRHGRTPVALLHDTGLLSRSTLAHAVVLDDEDLELVVASGAAVAHCPASNLKLASGVARVPDLLAAGVDVGIGTDGAASSNDLDLFVGMRLAGLVAKGWRGGASVLPAADVLRAATVGGARALGLGDRLGSIEVGKDADLVLLDADSPSLTPAPDPVSTVVYAASRADVVAVWAAGRAVVVDRETTTVDRRAAASRVRALAGV